jgi:hypothetical protein
MFTAWKLALKDYFLKIPHLLVVELVEIKYCQLTKCKDEKCFRNGKYKKEKVFSDKMKTRRPQVCSLNIFFFSKMKDLTN